jgi:hypothetical protein
MAFISTGQSVAGFERGWENLDGRDLPRAKSFFSEILVLEKPQ